MTRKWISAISLTLLMLLTACNGKSEDEASAIITQAMQTAEAQLTQNALAQPTATLTLVPTETVLPTDTPTVTPAPTSTVYIYSAQAAVSACDVAGFVSDVTIADGTEMDPGEEFTKTWELRNDGTCTWTSAYQLTFYSGSAMDADTPVEFTSDSVTSGETVEISVDLVAPEDEGTYTGYFILQNASGANFGIGTAGSPFYVQIVVGEADDTATETSTATSTTTSAASTTAPTATETLVPTATEDTGGG